MLVYCEHLPFTVLAKCLMIYVSLLWTHLLFTLLAKCLMIYVSLLWTSSIHCAGKVCHDDKTVHISRMPHPCLPALNATQWELKSQNHKPRLNQPAGLQCRTVNTLQRVHQPTTNRRALLFISPHTIYTQSWWHMTRQILYWSLFISAWEMFCVSSAWSMDIISGRSIMRGIWLSMYPLCIVLSQAELI